MTEINKKDSNASFVQQLSSYGVSMPIPRGGMKRNFRSSSVGPLLKRQRDDLGFQIKCKGLFKLPLECITVGEELRSARPAIVNTIKDSIRNNPSQHVTLIPVVKQSVDTQENTQDMAQSQDLFSEDTQDMSVKVKTLGGGHLVTAMRQIMNETPELETHLKEVPVRMYENLTPLEEVQVALCHQEMTSTTPLTFQDKVWMVRKMGPGCGDLVERVNKLFGVKSQSKYNNPYSHVISVAKYTDQEYRLFSALVDQWETTHGAQSVPTKFFQKIQGFAPADRVQWLERALEMGLNAGIAELGSQKAWHRTQSMMAEALGMPIQEAQDKYSEQMSKETLSPLIGKTIPEQKRMISELTQRDEDEDEDEDIEIKFSVKINGVLFDWETSALNPKFKKFMSDMTCMISEVSQSNKSQSIN